MDNFNKGFVTKNSISEGNNENELSQEMASKLKNPSRKQLPTKHFMFPTISAVSKAIVPKTKILAERNESVENDEQPCLSRSSSFDSKASKLSTDAGDDVQDNFVVDSSLHPYDPVKNYLSPRPKFLRYNPNRRRKIAVRQEKENMVVKNASFDAEQPSYGVELGANADGSTDASSQQEFVEEEKEMIEKGVGGDEDEDEKEEELIEFEEDGKCCSTSFVKFLLVVIALLLTTLAISSMNSPAPSPAVEAVLGFRSWYFEPQNVYRTVGLNFSEGVDLSMETDLVVGKLNKRGITNGFEEPHKKGLFETTDTLCEVQRGRIEDVCHDNLGSQKESSFQFQERKTTQIENNEMDASQYEENNEMDASQYEMWSKERNFAEEMEVQSEISDHSHEPEIVANEEIGGRNIDADKESGDQLLGTEFTQNYVVEEGPEANEKNPQLSSHEESKIVKKMVEDVVVKKGGNNDGVDEDEIEDIEATDLSITLARFGPISASIGGASILVIAALWVAYYSKKLRIFHPIQETVSHENSTDEEIKKLEPFAANPSSLVPKTEEKQISDHISFEKKVSHEISYTHAPTVELLGEFEIGEVTSSYANSHTSYRSSSLKDSNILAVAEMGNFSSSHAVHAKSSHTKPSFGDSPSYQSFTAEKKIVKRQRGKTAEASSMVTPSPVRRSSRIHNKSVKSP